LNTYNLFWNTCRSALSIALFTDAEEDVASQCVGKSRHISQEFFLVIIAIARKMFFVIKLSTLDYPIIYQPL